MASSSAPRAVLRMRMSDAGSPPFLPCSAARAGRPASSATALAERSVPEPARKRRRLMFSSAAKGLIWTITATPLSVLGRNLPAGGERGESQSEACEHGGHDAVATAALEREDVFQQRAEVPAQRVAQQSPRAQEADL